MTADNKFTGKGLTYDDVLVLPAYSEVLPAQVDLRSRITRNIIINIPIVSAAMDTVTDANLAIAIAREGGMGIIHKNMTVEKQVQQVRKVKRSESGMIKDPITLHEKATVFDALQIMSENKIGGIPVVDEGKKLLGILTNRDLRFEKNNQRPIADIMTKDNLITAEEDIDLQKAEAILQKYKIEKLPVVDAEGCLIGLITFKDIKKVIDHPHACKDEFGRLRVGAAVGVTGDTEERVKALVDAGADVITLDSAHGHSKGVLETAKLIKKRFPDLQLIVGNVATADGALAVAETGADAVKVGVGPGSICTTRIIAGVGKSQLTAVYECKQAFEKAGIDIPIIADGGIKYTGDLVKAIVAGGDCIMAGSLFAGVDEAPGETIIYEGRKFKTYRGMGSAEAMKEGSGDRYFQDPEEEVKKLVPEGIVGRVPYKGKLSEIIYQYIGGLRAGMGYAGANSIADLKKAQFSIITPAGVRESHPHDVTIIKESSNYSPY